MFSKSQINYEWKRNENNINIKLIFFRFISFFKMYFIIFKLFFLNYW